MMQAREIVKPLQLWLLGQGRCVGCGRPLAEGRVAHKNGIIVIACECRRMFVKDSNSGKFRKALFDEMN